jgi:PadR family transcriptional regulator PadR
LRRRSLYYNVVHMHAPSLGEFELAVLLAVGRLGDDAYGLRIQRDVSAIRRREYAVGAIYTTLQRLELKELVVSSMTDPLPVRGGRSRRQYQLTTTGKRALRAARTLATRLWSLDLGAATGR